MSIEPHGDFTREFIQEQRALDFVRFLGCEQDRGPYSAAERFLARYPKTFSEDIVRRSLSTKAAVLPGTSTNATWAGALVNAIGSAFVQIARSDSLLGRIPNLRTIPFNVRVPLETQAASYAWVPEGGNKPPSKLTFDPGITIPITKGVGVIVTTKELGLLSIPGSEVVLKDTLIAGLSSFTDKAFIDPTQAAIAGTQPASITNGTTAIVGTADFAASMKALTTAFWAGSPGTREPVLIASGGNKDAIGSLNGGAGLTYPVIASEQAGANVIMLDPRRVLVADKGITIDTSDQAMVEMDSAPTGGASAVLISLWQENKTGLMVERFVGWKALPNAVRYLTTV